MQLEAKLGLSQPGTLELSPEEVRADAMSLSEGGDAQRASVGAVLAVDRDAAPERDVADDLIAGRRAAALREAQHHVTDAFDADPELARGVGRPAALAARRDDRARALLILGGLAALEPRQDLRDDGLRRDLRCTECDVEVLRLA